MDLYEKINFSHTLEQGIFFHCLCDTLTELCVKYQDVPKLVFRDGKLSLPCRLSDELCVLDGYVPSLADNILYLAGKDPNGIKKSEFLRKSKEAFLFYWNQNAKGKRIRGGDGIV